MLAKDTREAALTRQLDFIPMESLDAQITIVGAGAIGSWVALSLAKMGFVDITVWDMDEVSIENMNCQFYPIDEIGQPKVLALQRMVERFTGTKINAVNMKYENQWLNGIVISALDNMETRKAIFDSSKGSADWIIDPRMSLEAASLFVCNCKETKSIESYAKTFYSSAEAIEERCTAKSTIYTANLIAGLVAKTVKDIAVRSTEDLIKNAEYHIGKNQLMAWSHAGAKF